MSNTCRATTDASISTDVLAQDELLSGPLNNQGASSTPISKEKQGAPFEVGVKSVRQPPKMTRPSAHFVSVRKISPMCSSLHPQGNFLKPELNFSLIKMHVIANNSGTFNVVAFATADNHAYPGPKRGFNQSSTCDANPNLPWNSWNCLTPVNHPSPCKFSTNLINQFALFSDNPISKRL
jgi:hypothetical protein